MSIIDYKINGETFYTHQTWLSSRQRRAWHNIPTQNTNLALYYTLGSLAVVAIGHKKIPLVSPFFKQLGFYTGSSVLSIGSWLGWSVFFKGVTSSELTSVIEANDCLYTPFWRTRESVINLRERANKDNFAANRFVNRSRGQYSKRENIQKFNPDLILQHPNAQVLIESVSKMIDIISRQNKQLDRIQQIRQIQNKQLQLQCIFIDNEINGIIIDEHIQQIYKNKINKLK